MGTHGMHVGLSSTAKEPSEYTTSSDASPPPLAERAAASPSPSPSPSSLRRAQSCSALASSSSSFSRRTIGAAPPPTVHDVAPRNRWRGSSARPPAPSTGQSSGRDAPPLAAGARQWYRLALRLVVVLLLLWPPLLVSSASVATDDVVV